MKRRELIKTLAGSVVWTRIAAQSPDVDVKRVLVMFKCHLDVGFTDTQAGVMRKYFDLYYPVAIKRATAMHQSGGDRYVWTTGSWMLYEYLEQAKGAARKKMEQAIAAGDIAWHALPFSWQSEVFDRSLMSGAIGFSKSLDRRFGRKTSGAKMTDVPGHTLGLIAPLAENGVKFLHIGVNSASTPPEVPSLFVWKNAEGASIVVMYQHKGYGGVVRVPGSDLAIAIAMGDDNTGPHSMDEIRQIYADLRRQFPAATITATDLTGIASAVDLFRGGLPEVTAEIGDTWIHGVASDPVKVARYREVARLRGQWVRQAKLKVGDATDLAFLRHFALVGEHTWGTDTKTYLDHDHYKPQDLRAALDQPGYKKMTTSWAEKRDNIDRAVDTLPASMRTQAKHSLAALKSVEPNLAGLQPFDPRRDFDSTHFTLAIDPGTGAIRRLRFESIGREWASSDRPLALFSYQTFSKSDYDRFLESYVTSKADWAPQDFGKPNIEHFGARSRVWTPKLLRCWTGTDARGDRVLVQLEIDDPVSIQSGLAAWPAKMYLELVLSHAQPVLEITLYCFDKVANRLPEAMWLTFRPDAPESGGWTLDKSDCPINPLKVVRGGNRHMHSLGRGLSYRDKLGGLVIDTLDAPVIALGDRSPIHFSYDQPDISQGVHFSLYNNTWGTNYIQWFGEDVRFRFRVSPL